MTWNVSDLTPERLHDVVEVEKSGRKKSFGFRVMQELLSHFRSSDAIK